MHNFPLLQKMLDRTLSLADNLNALHDEVELVQAMYEEELRHRVAISNLATTAA